jgi:hypothetical protein
LFSLLFGIGIIMCSSAAGEWIKDQNGNGASPSVFVIPGVFNIVFSLILGTNAYKNFNALFNKKRATDNSKYFFSWQSMFIVGLLSLYIVITSFTSISGSILTQFNVWNAYDSSLQIGKVLWYFSFISLIISLGILITLFVIATINNPKRDLNKLNELIAKYSREFSDSQRTVN